MEKGTKNRIILSSGLALFAPFIVESIYILVSRSIKLNIIGVTDWIAIVICVIAGFVGVYLLPMNLTTKIGLSILYVPVVAISLFFYSFFFVCAVFELCL